MIFAVVLFLVYLTSAFLLAYAYDENYKWSDKPSNLNLRQPSLSDLLTDDKYLAEMYVSKEICPAYFYFSLRAEIEAAAKRTGEWSLLSYVMVYLASLMLFSMNLRTLGIIPQPFLCWLVSIILWIAAGFLVSFIYKRYFRLPSFSYNESHYAIDKESILSNETEYGESNEAALNNTVIRQHLSFLLSIKNTLFFRFSLARILGIIIGFIYFLFFFSPKL